MQSTTNQGLHGFATPTTGPHRGHSNRQTTMRLDHSSCKVMNLQSRREKNETAFEKVERANETFAVYRCCKPRKPNEFSSRSSTKITCSELLLHLPLAHCQNRPPSQTHRLPKKHCLPTNQAGGSTETAIGVDTRNAKITSCTRRRRKGLSRLMASLDVPACAV